MNSMGWFHILSDGKRLNSKNYAWCGNFQNGVCVVRNDFGEYFHIGIYGAELYQQKYSYAGDFKDGIAVIQNQDGLYTHIYIDGKYVHNKWFYDLDIFHKGFSRAKDYGGWHHVDINGNPIYVERYQMAEPFYNGFARVEDEYGAILIINEHGEVVRTLRDRIDSPLQKLSADLVGYWKTQTIRAAVELNIFNFLPSNDSNLAALVGLELSVLKRLLRALCELGLVYRDKDLLVQLTEKGMLLRSNNDISLSSAAKHWGSEPYLAWTCLKESLKSNCQSYSQKYGEPVFEWLDRDPNILNLYHDALLAYAKHDYRNITAKVNLSNSRTVIDAAGGEGILLGYVLEKYNHLEGFLLERESVIQNIIEFGRKNEKFSLIAFDLFKKWPKSADVIFLSRVMHDWDDNACVAILKRARDVLLLNGAVYLVEMILDEASSDGGMLDLNMLVLTGGMERTREQFDRLAIKSGLILVDVIYLNGINFILKMVVKN